MVDNTDMNYAPEAIAESNEDGLRVLQAWQELHQTRANLADLDRLAAHIAAERDGTIERNGLQIEASAAPIKPELAQKLATLSIQNYFTEKRLSELQSQQLDQTSDLTRLLLSYTDAEVVAAATKSCSHAIRTISGNVYKGFTAVAWGRFTAGMIGYSTDSFALRALGRNWHGDVRVSDHRSYEIIPVATTGDPAIHLQVR